MRQTAGLTADACRPTGLDLRVGEQVLEIAWADGVKSVLPAAVLRRSCPCAACRTDREKRSHSVLPILSSAPGGEIRLTGGNVVGNYAVQLQWSDGHSSGIFDFRFLRSLHDAPGAQA